jgi:hypothetical protein
MHFVNTRRVFVLVIGACVAALSISSCSAQPPEQNPAAVRTPAITETAPAGYDRWEEAYGGPADIPEMTAMAKYYGLDSIDVPSDEYANDYVGVSRLESFCVIAFYTTVEEAEGNLMNVLVMSRYNESYFIILPSLPQENVRPMLDKYRPLCSGDATLSEATTSGEGDKT